MFFYLIIGVIVLSAILSLMGVSVTELIAVPVPVEATPDFYEDVSEYTLSGVGIEDVDYEIVEQTTRDQEPAEYRGHPLHVYDPLFRTSRASARWPSRSSP